MGYEKFVSLLFIISCLFSVISSQSSIPTKPDGFWYGEKKGDQRLAFIEAFFDPVCPDSRDSWPPLKKAIQHYSRYVSLALHTFPLPYHDNAFATSRALHIVDEINSSSTFPLLEAIFKNQEKFYHNVTKKLPRDTVIDRIVKLATKVTGNKHHNEIERGFFNQTETDHATRVGFKYGCLRGVYGTPYFFVNGFPIPDAGSALNYSGWRAILDPLVGNIERSSELHKSPVHK